MPKITFLPEEKSIDVAANTKILVAGNRLKVPIRFGCGACRCGTCAVAVNLAEEAALSTMQANEKDLLSRMRLPTHGGIRLACQARVITGHIVVDLSFQENYCPETGEDG